MSEENSAATNAKTNKTAKIAIAGVIWFFVGLTWFLLQFLLSEGIYRVSDLVYESDETLGDTLVDVSDAIAWPAGEIFDRKLSQQVEEGFHRAMDDEAVDPAVKQKIESLAKDQDYDFSDYDLQTEVATALQDYPSYEELDFLSTGTEYAIYVGVCFIWGIVVALLGFVITVFFTILGKPST